MTPQCRNCAGCVPQIYDRQQQPIARCTHIGFRNAGYAVPPDHVGEPIQVETLPEGMDHLNEANSRAIHTTGRAYHDLIDIKASNARFCRHWHSPLSRAPEILAFYDDTAAAVLAQIPDLHPAIAAWFAAGSPTEPCDYPKLNPALLWTYPGCEAPAATLAAYEPCVTCRFYEPALSTEGAPLPFKGACNRGHATRTGVLALAPETPKPRTYTFLGCTNYQPNPTYTIATPQEPPIELPVRLTIYVETNPLPMPLDLLTAICRFPVVTTQRVIRTETLDALYATDLSNLLRTRHRQIDFNQFLADMALTPVVDFFAKSLKAGAVAQKTHWSPYEHYKTAEDDLFGKPGEKP